MDRSSDIEPENKAETAKFEKLFDSRSTADELQEKGILKGGSGRAKLRLMLMGLTGPPTDGLAGKKADLEKAMMEVRLPSPDFA